MTRKEKHAIRLICPEYHSANTEVVDEEAPMEMECQTCGYQWWLDEID